MQIPENDSDINATFIAESFRMGLDHLKTRVQYVFSKTRANPLSWTLSTWSKHVRPSHIRKHGTDADKALLQELNQKNKPRQPGLKRKKKLKDKRKVRRRVQTNNNTAQANNNNNNVPDDGSETSGSIHSGDTDEIKRPLLLHDRKQPARNNTRNNNVSRNRFTPVVPAQVTVERRMESERQNVARMQQESEREGEEKVNELPDVTHLLHTTFRERNEQVMRETDAAMAEETAERRHEAQLPSGVDADGNLLYVRKNARR